MEKNKISIVVPCFNEKEALPLFYNKITQVFNQMSQASETSGLSYELIIVDDGSMDGTLDVAKELATNDSGVKYISFSRNFGKEAAMYAGLQHAVGEYVAIMDADLQDPPEMLPKMYQVLTKEGYDAVGTRRVTRKGEPAIRSFFARKFYRLMSRISKANMVDGARDYRLMNRKYVDALLSLKEYNRFSKGLFGWVGFKVKWLEFENIQRVCGTTKWSFWGLFIYAIDGIVAFSTAPVRFAAWLGIAFKCSAIHGFNSRSVQLYCRNNCNALYHYQETCIRRSGSRLGFDRCYHTFYRWDTTA